MIKLEIVFPEDFDIYLHTVVYSRFVHDCLHSAPILLCVIHTVFSILL